MKHLTISFFLFFALAFFPANAWSVDVKVHPWKNQGPFPEMNTAPSDVDSHPTHIQYAPGTPPPNAFPMVCYIVGMPGKLFEALRHEESNAKNSTNQANVSPRPLAEQYKNGIDVPQYIGYLVVDSSFRITFVSRFSETETQAQLDLYGPIVAMNAPRWSWNGVREILRQISWRWTYFSMAYTLGEKPDLKYVPEIKRTIHMSLSHIKEGKWREDQTFLASIDPTITNLKPGMRFRLMTEDMELE